MVNQVAVSAVDQAGDIGGNGISRFYWVVDSGNADPAPADVDAVHTALHAFYSSFTQFLPGSMSYAIQPEVNLIDLQTSELVNIISGTVAQSTIKGSATSGNHAAGIGARINWVTSVVLNGRRLRGAVYIVPLGDNAFESDGAINGSAQGVLIGAASTLVGALTAHGATMVVYHRNPKGQDLQGTAGPVIAWKVGTTPASLRSRRV